MADKSSKPLLVQEDRKWDISVDASRKNWEDSEIQESLQMAILDAKMIDAERAVLEEEGTLTAKDNMRLLVRERESLEKVTELKAKFGEMVMRIGNIRLNGKRIESLTGVPQIVVDAITAALSGAEEEAADPNGSSSD